MSYIFGDNVNFNKNEATKLRLGNEITFPSLQAGDAGYVFYHTANEKFYGWTGSDWTDFATGITGGGDDLGNHRATQDLDLDTYKLLDVTNINFAVDQNNSTPLPGLSYNTTNGFYFFPHAGQPFGLFADSLTNVAKLTIPNKSGTLALLDDVYTPSFPSPTIVILDSGELTYNAVTDLYSTNPTTATLRHSQDGKFISYKISIVGNISNWVSGTEYTAIGTISLNNTTYDYLIPVLTNQSIFINMFTNYISSSDIVNFDILRAVSYVNDGPTTVNITYAIRIKANFTAVTNAVLEVNLHALYPIV